MRGVLGAQSTGGQVASEPAQGQNGQGGAGSHQQHAAKLAASATTAIR